LIGFGSQAYLVEIACFQFVIANELFLSDCVCFYMRRRFFECYCFFSSKQADVQKSINCPELIQYTHAPCLDFKVRTKKCACLKLFLFTVFVIGDGASRNGRE
jgi:hypothetical protein